MLCDLGLGKLDFIKIKQKTALEKNTVKRLKRQVINWEKNLANHISDKGSIPRIHIELSKFNN